MLHCRAVNLVGRIHVFVVSFMLLSALLALDAHGAEKTKIVFWGWGQQDRHIEAVLPSFYEKYPNIEVELQMFSFQETHEKLAVGFAAGAVPDVSMIEMQWFARLKAENEAVFADLGRPPFDAGRYAGAFVPYRWSLVEGTSGAVIGIPIDIGPTVTFYRRSAFESAGMSGEPDRLAQELETWDQFLVVGQRMARDTNGDGVNDAFLIGSAETVWDVMRGQTALSAIDAEGRVNIDSQDWVEALEYAVEFRSRGFDAMEQIGYWGSDQYWSGLTLGSIATEMRGSWFGGALSDRAPDSSGDWGMIPLPGGVGVNQGGSYVVIPAASPNKEAAWAFVEHVFATAASQAVMLDVIDYFPSYIPAFSEPIFSESSQFYGGQNVRRLLAEVALQAPDVDLHPLQQEAMQRVTEHVRRVFAGEVSPRGALEAAAQEVRALVADTR